MSAAAIDLLAAPAASADTGLRQVAELRRAVLGLARDFDAGGLPGREAARVVEHVTAMRNALATVVAAAAKRVVETRQWKRSGAPSAEVWLAGQAGTTVGQARDALATAERLESLPATAAAARRGELSPAKAAAVSDAAVAAPHKEAALLETAATQPLGVLRDAALAVKAAADVDPMATYTRLRAQRALLRGRDGEGMWTAHMRTTADDGARVDVALEPIIDELFHAARKEGRREPRAAYAADALVELCRRATEGWASAGGQADGSISAQLKPTKVPERFLALIRVDAAALQRGSAADGEVCEIAGVGPVPVALVRKLLGESVAKLVITHGVDVANVTHLGRGLTAAQRVAKLWEQPICVVAGCGRRVRLQYDHDEPWCVVHETVLGNMNRLCADHHDLKTYQGWSLVDGAGVRPMVAPDDPRHPRHKPPPRPDDP